MTYHFTQELTIERTGFGNTLRVSVGAPTPVADDLLEGSKLVSFNQHAYLAKDGYGGYGSELPEEPVQSCVGSLVRHYRGVTEEVHSKDYGEHPSFWGIAGEESAFEFEVDYDSTVHVDWTLDRVVFPSVTVEKDGELHVFEGVPCLYSGTTEGTFRMWGETESWGSEGEKVLFWPYIDVK